MPHGQNAGFLGKLYDPFVLNADPSEPNFTVPDLLPPDYISSVRVDRRRSLREMVDSSVKNMDASQDARLLNTTFHQAYTLMSSAKAREAFSIKDEPEKTRERYGLNRFGQSCLLARRLVERGVRFVTVNMFETVFNEITWDIHGSKPFSPISCYRDLVGPMFDHAYASLLEDLQERGLLEKTIVVAMGEFGRTPKINPAGGRDHWPQAWTILIGGGGIKGGRVVGSTDEIGAYPVERPDLARRGCGNRLPGTGNRPRVKTFRDLREGRSGSSITESNRSANFSKSGESALFRSGKSQSPRILAAEESVLGLSLWCSLRRAVTRGGGSYPRASRRGKSNPSTAPDTFPSSVSLEGPKAVHQLLVQAKSADGPRAGSCPKRGV